MALIYYNADINVYKPSPNWKKDVYGTIVDQEYDYITTLKAAVAPVNMERAREEYGISKNVSYEIIVDPTELFNYGTVVEYKGEKFKVESVLDWSNTLLPDMGCVQFVVSRLI